MSVTTPTSPPPAPLSPEDSQSAYTVLIDIFGNINEQLRFAETKNGALLTLDLAVVFGIASLMGDHASDMSMPVQAGLISIAAGCAIAAVITLLSFLPELKPRKRSAKVLDDPSNIFFFGHIRAHSEAEYLRLVYAGLGLPTGQPLPAHFHLANQIGSNSKNAHKKFVFFAVGATITLLSLVLPVLMLGVLRIMGLA
jgi:hypothetical protein